MAVSTEGILVFGFQVGSEDEPPEWLMDEDGNMMDFDDFVCGPYSSGEDYAIRSAAMKACPADTTLFCSYDYPMLILAVNGTEKRVYRGDAVEIDPASLMVEPARVAAFKLWCEQKSIAYEEPKWWLVSMWG